jgi:hypothetical protein
LPGALELRPRACARVCGAARPDPPCTASAEAGRAGRRSKAEGGRGRGSCASCGGPCESRRACVNGIRGTGVRPRPPSTIATSQARKSRYTRRPVRRIHLARRPLASSRTGGSRPSAVVLRISIVNATRTPLAFTRPRLGEARPYGQALFRHDRVRPLPPACLRPLPTGLTCGSLRGSDLIAKRCLDASRVSAQAAAIRELRVQLAGGNGNGPRTKEVEAAIRAEHRRESPGPGLSR